MLRKLSVLTAGVVLAGLTATPPSQAVEGSDLRVGQFSSVLSSVSSPFCSIQPNGKEHCEGPFAFMWEDHGLGARCAVQASFNDASRDSSHWYDFEPWVDGKFLPSENAYLGGLFYFRISDGMMIAPCEMFVRRVNAQMQPEPIPEITRFRIVERNSDGVVDTLVVDTRLEQFNFSGSLKGKWHKGRTGQVKAGSTHSIEWKGSVPKATRNYVEFVSSQGYDNAIFPVQHPKSFPTRITIPKGLEGQLLEIFVGAWSPNAIPTVQKWTVRVAETRKSQKASWIESVGTKRGSAVVGSTIKITKPKYSKVGKKQKLKVSYQWKQGIQIISGATKSTYRVTTGDRKRNLSVRVTFSKPGYRPVVKTVSFGKAR